MNEPKDQSTGTPSACHCYVAVLRRAIPVNDYSTDTATHVIKDGETVRDVMDWAERLCMGSAVMISVEIVKSS